MQLLTSAGDPVAQDAVDGLREQLRGRLLTAEDPEYDAGRRIWNSYYDRLPGAIARCAGAADVVSAVRFAAEHDLLLAVRGGGHSFAGHSTCDGGLVLDLSPQKGIRVDPGRRTALAQPGLLQGELDAEAYHFGLAVTGAQESYIGISGLTLGGGIGWLCRYRGLTCDNLLSADVVLADGELRRASPQDDADLYWAIRGGGGNFGVATSFEYRLHPQGDCLAGLLAYPIDQAGTVARGLAEFNQNAPDELGTSFAFLTTPDGDPAIGVGFVHADPVAGVEDAVRPLSTFGPELLMNHVGTMPYVAVQRMLDQNTVAGRRQYARSFLLPELTEEVLETLAEGYTNTPSALTLVGGLLIGGAMARVDPGATAFVHRQEGYLVSMLCIWEDESEDEANIEWARQVYERVRPHTSDAVYVNHLGDDGGDRVRAAYGQHYQRLATLKAKYDPSNLFRANHNIQPAV